jgi:hypothetical protein
MDKDKYIKLPKEWTDFESLVENFDSDKTYIIFNRGNFNYMGINAESTPASTELGGTPTVPNDYSVFIKGTKKLFLRSLDGETYINISEGE